MGKKRNSKASCDRCGRVTDSWEIDWDRERNILIKACTRCHGDYKHHERKATKEDMKAFLMYYGTPFEKSMKEILSI